MKNLILLALIILIAGCDTKTEDEIKTDPNDFLIEPYNAIVISIADSVTKWIVPTFEDLKQCTDKERANISICVSIGKSARTAEDMIWICNKYMPERFKVEPVSKIGDKLLEPVSNTPENRELNTSKEVQNTK